MQKFRIWLIPVNKLFTVFTFTAELAELLSADMQKEDLHGRTLTLKLKTAAFEVLFYFRIYIVYLLLCSY